MNWIPNSIRPTVTVKPIPLYKCMFCGFKWNCFENPEKCPACGRTGHIKRIGGV